MKVIYIDIDTLRPDHMGCYGYHPTTPNIDLLASDSHRFTNAFAANTPCMPARASIFTCRFGAKNGIETHGMSALTIQGDYGHMLPAVLSRQGILTATVSSFGQHPSPWFFTGFAKVVDPALTGKADHFQHIAGSEVNKQAIKILEDLGGEDVLLHLHYWDPHTPLVPPREFLDRIDFTSDLSHIDEAHMKALVTSATYRGGQEMGVHCRKDLESMIKRYDAEILYTDHLIGELVSYLKERGLYDDTMIVLSSDHGEQYGEGGLIAEHGSVHDSCIRVPLIVKLPHSEGAGSVHDEFIYTLDIGCTVTDALQCSPAEDWHGRSFLPLLRGETYARRDYVVCDHGLYTCQRAIRTHDWKMVHTYHPGIWDIPEYSLFHLAEDPNEYVDVSEEYPGVLNEFIQREKNWLDEFSPLGIDMLKTIARTCGPDGFQSH